MKTTNQNFPLISHINDILPHINGKPELRFIPQVCGGEAGWLTICYMISGNDTFSNDFARECRGITFDAKGRIAGRPFHKFFNVGERESTQKHNLPWDDVHCIMEKLDGSMITVCIGFDGRAYCRTKKTFDGDTAKMAQAFLDTKENIQNLCKYLNSHGLSPIFEYTSPKMRIVINHAVENMQLLAIRELESGAYLSRATVSKFGQDFSVDVVPVLDIPPEDIFKTIATLENCEGYVVQFNNGDMVKLKSDWYMKLHHNCVFQRVRDIAEMCLDETLDDFKGYLKDSAAGESLAKVLDIEKIVAADILDITSKVDSLYEEHATLSRAELAAKFKKHEFFSLIMKRVDAADISEHVKKYYRRNILKDKFGLEQV